MTPIENEIWCDVHGCLHEATEDPYGYGYAMTDEEPECRLGDWRKVWIGAQVEA